VAFANKDLVGATAYTAGLWYGSAMWAAVAATVGACLGLVLGTRRPAAADASGAPGRAYNLRIWTPRSAPKH
jgi:hypothetical protein